MRRRRFLLALAIFAGCAERDNPFDPVNLPARPAVDPQPIGWIPTPGGHVWVVLPDSARRDPGPTYTGNLAGTLPKLHPGDTVYVYGGGGDYLLSGQITMSGRGTSAQPITLLSFGGRARFRMVEQTEYATHQQYCLKIENSHVRIVGFSFVGGTNYAIQAGGDLMTDGSVDLDSVDLDRPGGGIQIVNLRGPVKVRNMVIRNAFQNRIPVDFKGDSLLDTSNIFW